SLQPYTGTVYVGLIENPSYVAGAGGANQALCDGAQTSSPQAVVFNGETQKTIGFSYPEAHKGLGFKVSFGEEGNLQHVCSRDPGGFAVRPASYTFETDSNLFGGDTYTLTIKVEDTGNNPTTYYTQSSNKIDAKMELDVPAGCALPAWNQPIPLTGAFINGTLTYLSFSYSNVGDIKVTVEDEDWTSVDQGSVNGKGYDDCIVGSYSNVPAGGKVGCNVSKEETFSFVATKFENTASFINAQPFYYTSGGNGVSPTLQISTQALLSDDTVATNYTQSCFANNINTDLTLAVAPQTLKDIIAYLPDNNTLVANNEDVTISTLENEFNAGMADVRIFFNFSRQVNTTHEPFRIFLGDFNVTSIADSSGLTGVDFDRTLNVDHNATFYYGRVHAPDQRFWGKSGAARVHYEVYCKDCNRTDFNATGTASPDTLYWFQNDFHDNLADGNVTLFNSVGNVRFSNANYGAAPATAQTTAVANGLETQNLIINQTPYTDRIRFTPSSWLIHDPFDSNA
ncbi:MAG: hypothetical protein IBX45_14185, partial [Campylobacterales bacterium]|nr:hypothetical protein [Campylobacterales bacterium]